METTNNRKLIASAVLIVASVALLLGLTFAWFTDTAANKGNKIQAGTLQVALLENGADIGGSPDPVFDHNLWEPGYSTGKASLAVENIGSLAVKYELSFQSGDLSQSKGIENVIDVYVDDVSVGTLATFLNGSAFDSGTLEAGASSAARSVYLKMQESAGNTYQGAVATFDILLKATQAPVEKDGFGDDQYDKDAAYAWDGATKTEVVPDQDGVYRVSTGSDLAWIAQAVADGTLGKARSGEGVTVELQSDIDLGGNEWTPIGGDNPFTGTFDGKGHTIENLTASSNPSSSDPTRGVALFGYAENATVKNLKIVNCNLQGRYATSAVVGDGCAPLAFENIEVASGTIASIQDVGDKQAQVAGGILGQGWGPSGSSIAFAQCVNSADVTVNKWHAGGIWGSITASGGENVDVISLADCVNYGSITAIGSGYAGGLGAFAYAGNCVISGCSNSGTVSAASPSSEFVAAFNDAPINGNTVS